MTDQALIHAVKDLKIFYEECRTDGDLEQTVFVLIKLRENT